ncbi:xanthine dehydrogenase molybdopterin binding subunit [Chiayiivirga flava]|uniref:Xanthine dehydrogenase large subunit n=1 Tax=Chiayiivirga flava TaxID=659595 RepID=A0A7W8D680_9GAMM|nr:xanthine dehydrogenase molybdopterin binding subunit [Chiayiivirga flava]MBB5207466.1 xanthine dehydrogenase large subunit [Chiayiivirga flava]
MSLRHESAVGHVTGRAIYTDEQHEPAGMLSLWPVQAPHAHARFRIVDTSAARAMPGVRGVLVASDIPGENNTGPIKHDEPLIPVDTVEFHGQAVAWVIAVDEAHARAAAAAVQVHYEPLPARLSIADAIADDAFHMPATRVARGDAAKALADAPHRIDGELHIGGQDHFYLETQASWTALDADGLLQIVASTQHPSETQAIVAHVLGIHAHRVLCRCLRMGGGFGGKETQANPYAAIAALATWITRQPVRIKLQRQLDMQMTGKRHPFFARYRAGFDDNGLLHAIAVDLVADGGWSSDLSPPVLMRTMVHIDNAYFVPHVEIVGRIAKTHLASNTAFRGFGGPQGMVVGEEILDRVARHLRLPAHAVRERNFYRPAQVPDRNTTHYGQPVVDNHLPQLWAQLLHDSGFAARRDAATDFNAAHPHAKRGIAITPVKFGISFNKTEYNQAGALVHIYADGSIQLNHGGTEMGQGLHTKMIEVARRTLGVSRERIQLMATSTDKVPNTSATAASSGSDLNGQAVKAACDTLLARLAPVAATLLQGAVGDVVFADDGVFLGSASERRLSFEEVVGVAYHERVSLSATGYYRTPVIHWDPAAGQGHPFYYFAYGAAVSEVELCGYTGVHRLLRVDLLHDVGESIAEHIDRGQIEGGFVQGLGWLTCEELRWNAKGKLLTDAPSTYKIPTLGDVPHAFHVALFRRSDAPSTNVIFGSKGVGEPPLMLALSVREALRDAVAAFGDARAVALACPSTPEALLTAIDAVRAR